MTERKDYQIQVTYGKGNYKHIIVNAENSWHAMHKAFKAHPNAIGVSTSRTANRRLWNV